MQAKNALWTRHVPPPVFVCLFACKPNLERGSQRERSLQFNLIPIYPVRACLQLLLILTLHAHSFDSFYRPMNLFLVGRNVVCSQLSLEPAKHTPHETPRHHLKTDIKKSLPLIKMLWKREMAGTVSSKIVVAF